MKKKIWLIGGLVVLVALIIWGVIWGPQTLSFYWYEYLNRKHLAEFEAIEETYRTDTNGGETPEETLDLFVAALEAGDAGLAASYFVPEKRGEMEKQFKAGFESGGVELLLGEVKKEEEKHVLGYDIEGNSVRFEFSDGDSVGLTIDLIKNPNSQKWLIESL